MKNIVSLILFFLGLAFISTASPQRKSVPSFYIYNSVKNTSLKTGEAHIVLHFNASNFGEVPPGYETVVFYSVNDKTDTLFLNAAFTQTIQVKSGKNKFRFWAGPGYNEIITDSIDIAGQTTNNAQVTFNSEMMMIMVDKPVIYLQSPVKLDFSLNVDPANEFTFTYPSYKDQWKGTLFPNGEIEIGGEKYPYLFWDSRQEFKLKKHTNGYHLAKKDVIPFLEKQLSATGLTFTEKADFITYWGPRLTQYESVFVQIYLQEDCDRFATIRCEPKPEQVNRLYIGFSKWNESFNAFLNPVELPAFTRTGFNILEWGGFELKPIEL